MQHVFGLQCMPLVRHYKPRRRRLQPVDDVEIHGGGWAEAELISHSGREGSVSRPLVSYCQMKCLRSFVNVLIDLCPQTGTSGVVSRRLFSTPRDAFISCCWPALHPHYRAALPHTLPDCCNNFRHFYFPRQVVRQSEQFGGLTSNVRLLFESPHCRWFTPGFVTCSLLFCPGVVALLFFFFFFF